ncbi:MAG: hypothetical protein IKQ60_07480 [Candidatus Methanomethylophilaceae archaeon]|nr:hypothetical protein [Candidatus Methanomethylophilaceae archaeon]
MSSGRKRRIMIACVTFETAKITEPIEFYEANRIHLIRYSKDPDDKEIIYNLFYERVVELVGQMGRDIEIVEHNEVVFDFRTMLRTVLEIIQSENRKEEGCEIYVNVSAGTSEYTAASTIASMMVPGTVPFTVNSREYTVDSSRIKDLYFIDGKPVGLTKVSSEPMVLPSYTIDIPEEHLVRALRILDDRISSRLPANSTHMVDALKDAGIWYRDIEPKDGDKASARQTEAVYYQRDFIYKWLKNGWIAKSDRNGKYVVTELGRRVLDTFYTI